MSQTVSFTAGLTAAQDDELNEIQIEISRLVLRVEELPRHRSLSLAVTKLDEARHWLRDRKHRPA